MRAKPVHHLLFVVALVLALFAAGCGSSTDDAAAATGASVTTSETSSSETQATATPATETPAAETPAAETIDSGESSDPSESAEEETVDTPTGSSAVRVRSCEEIASEFTTNGPVNADLADPEVSAVCDGDTLTVVSNGIPDFVYIETSPGNPNAQDLEFSFPATPTVADATSAVAALGPIGVAINGVPIYGATEGTGGDVLSLGGGFTECGGHNGPTGYHFHTFDISGSDPCLFSEAEATAGPVLFGFAFDGYPIYSGNFQFTSSYELTDASLFASDTWAAHTYVDDLSELDECNGFTDEDGNYAYYTTDAFPYTVGCYRGEVDASVTAGAGGGGPGRGERP